MRNSKPHHQRRFPEKKRDRLPIKTTSPREAFTLEKTDGSKGSSYWLFGHHALSAALQNPQRRFKRLLHMGNKVSLPETHRQDLPVWELVNPQEFNHLLPRDAVHQGIAGLTYPLEEPEIENLCEKFKGKPQALLLLLDQVTDPHNVGAILRSAAAFGADAIILTERHAAPQSGALAKAASGALEVTPLCRVVNLAQALERIKAAGFWCVGLAGEAERELSSIDLKGKIALILGSEEHGLRRLTREKADFLARLPTQGPVDQLNVSNAAAIALYEVSRQR